MRPLALLYRAFLTTSHCPFQHLGQLPLNARVPYLLGRRLNTQKTQRRRSREEKGGAYLKKHAARSRTPESLQGWKPCPLLSVCQLADIGMRGVFIGNVRRQTFGGHLVWYSSLSQSLISSFPSGAQNHGRATPERRERASIYDQSRVRNKLQPVLETYSYFFSSKDCIAMHCNEMLTAKTRTRHPKPTAY